MTDRSIAALEVKFCISAPIGFPSTRLSLLRVRSGSAEYLGGGADAQPVYPKKRTSSLSFSASCLAEHSVGIRKPIHVEARRCDQVACSNGVTVEVP